MSRSYKKHPICKYGGYGKYGKGLAKRQVRNTALDEDISNCSYKKYYPQWDIYDNVDLFTEQDARKYYRYRKQRYESGIDIWSNGFFWYYPTEEIFINKYWRKFFKRK